MRSFLLNILLLFALTGTAQDKIYLLNGEKRMAKVTEIGVDEIKFTMDGDKLFLAKSEVLLIEFENGMVEIINRPTENKAFANEEKAKTRHLENTKKLDADNLISVNSLALCNSDVSVFYEKLLAERNYGVGVMGAYNFNPGSGLFNSNIFPLPNGKKNYDLGCFVNLYIGKNKQERSFYLGLMLKYTSLSFSQTIINNSNVSYKQSSGYQLATLVACGNQRFFSNGFFVKTIYGIGGFNLTGNYRTEYNYQRLHTTNRNGTGRNSLMKLYLGINIGLSF